MKYDWKKWGRAAGMRALKTMAQAGIAGNGAGRLALCGICNSIGRSIIHAHLSGRPARIGYAAGVVHG